MGKVKSRRQKLHTAAVKLKQREDTKSVAEPEVENKDVEIVDMSTGDTRGTDDTVRSPFIDNPFGGMRINMSDVHKDLPDMDAQSCITSKTTRGLNLTKKDKRKLKHEFWMKKVDTIQKIQREKKARKKRKNTPVVGDMQLLADTLPTLELLLKDNKPLNSPHKKGSEPQKKKGIAKAKTRQKNMMTDMAVFQQVLKHPAYKSNPRGTISEHLHNWHKQQDTTDS